MHLPTRDTNKTEPQKRCGRRFGNCTGLGHNQSRRWVGRVQSETAGHVPSPAESSRLVVALHYKPGFWFCGRIYGIQIPD
jgi:hypothetical protein